MTRPEEWPDGFSFGRATRIVRHALIARRAAAGARQGRIHQV
jgi:hypothetical protein